MDLKTLLPTILPLAVDWALKRAAEIRREGVSLRPDYLELAEKVGVKNPHEVRVLTVNTIPFPENPILQQAAAMTGMLGPNLRGLTLGNNIYIRHGDECVRLLSHELRHVHQYEYYGSVEAFLTEYLKQIIEYGYKDAPLEVDAQQHEIHK